MSREWKPGDVAIVNGTPITFFYKRDGSGHATDEVMFNNGAGFQHRAHHLAGCARRAVILDPEDRAQVEAFRDLYDHECTVQQGITFANTKPERGNAMQAALRSLITPPKPEEPTGLGAVVEDADGNMWVRNHPPTCADRAACIPWRRVWPDSATATWRDIAVATVIHPGVTP